MKNTKSFLSDMTEIANSFSQYIRRNKFTILLLSAFIFLLHGSKLYSASFGIDTEKILSSPEDLYASWYGIGRYGLTVLKMLGAQMNFNPFLAGIMTLLFLDFAMIAFGFLFTYVHGSTGPRADAVSLFVFGAAVTAHPIITEQLYFSLQGVEVTLSFVFCAVSLLFAHEWCRLGSRLYFVCAVALLPLIFSVYQSFVPLYIFGVVALCCLNLPFSPEAAGPAAYFKYIGKHIIVFLTGFFLNQIIITLFFPQSDYLANQMQWDINNMGDGIRRILAHIFSVLLGRGTFYSASFLLIAILLLVLWSLGFVWHKKPGSGVLNLFLLGALYLGPFYLTIVLGEQPVVRAQLVLPFATGFMLYLICVLLYSNADRDKQTVNTSGKLAFSILALSCIWQEADVSGRLYFTDTVRFQQDASLAENIEQDIAKLTNEANYQGTVVFIGESPATYSSSYVTGDVMGQSFFAWDTDVEPLNFWSSGRIVDFMNCMGSNYQAPTQKEAADATARAANMPSYPEEGSIIMQNDMVIVKLSE